MSKENLTYRDEILTLREKKTLIFRFVIIFLFGATIGSIAGYFLFFTTPADFKIPAIIFSIFFFGILVFILFTAGRNVFEKTKRVYTGIVTDKYEESSKNRNSGSSNTYFISLDDEPFSLDLLFYDKIHKGEKIEIHCLRKNYVFNVNKVEETTLHQETQRSSSTIFTDSLESYITDSNYELIIRKSFRKALLFRAILGLLGAGLLFYVILFICLFIHLITAVSVIVVFVLCIVLWALLNKKTVRLLRDIFNKEQIEIFEKVIDLQMSNVPKPSQHSTVTYQGSYYNDDRFFYVQTNEHWIQISGELYLKLKAGDDIKLTLAKYSKIVLDINLK